MMVGLPRDRLVTVKWCKFEGNLMSREIYDSDELWKPSVYVITDSRGRPLYVGKATAKKHPGFGDRYWGNLQAMSAWGHDTRNRLYVGRIRGATRAWYRDLERQLIALESRSTQGDAPLYNDRWKHDSEPDPEVRLRHIGDIPRFYHLGRGPAARSPRETSS